MREHFRRHWHHHVSLWGIFALLVMGTAGAAAAYHFGKGGFRRGPLPPAVRVMGGPAVPPGWSLDRWVVRIHNQGNSNSCVAQTAATVGEIAAAESGRPVSLSAGFVYNQINGGKDAGATYQGAFWILQNEGDATLAEFPPDGGSEQFVLPAGWVIRWAWAHHITGWRSIFPWDRHTIQEEIYGGRAIAVAVPVTDSIYAHWDGSVPWITGQYGTFHFYHSMTIVGYSPFGVEVLNSWGPAWGRNGRGWLSWDFLRVVNAALVISSPYVPPHARVVTVKRKPGHQVRKKHLAIRRPTHRRRIHRAVNTTRRHPVRPAVPRLPAGTGSRERVL